MTRPRTLFVSLAVVVLATSGCEFIKLNTGTTSPGSSGASGGGTEAKKDKPPPTSELPEMVEPGESAAELGAIKVALDDGSSYENIRVAFAKHPRWKMHRNEDTGVLISRSKEVWLFYRVTEDLPQNDHYTGECYYQRAYVGQESAGPNAWNDWGFFGWRASPIAMECEAPLKPDAQHYFGESAE